MINGYTEGEICMLYRRAKNKKAQINILTQLTDLSEYGIKKILMDGGYLMTDEKKKMILEHYNKGLSDTKIAREVGMAQNTISKFLREQGLPSKGKCNNKNFAKRGENAMTVEELKKYEEKKNEVKEKANEAEEKMREKVDTVKETVAVESKEILTVQQYYELAKLSLELIKLIWE